MNNKIAEYSRKYNAARYARLKESGLCVTCGVKPVVPGKVRCAKCNEEIRKASELVYRVRHNSGYCLRCGKEPHAEGRACCPACLEKGRQESARRYAKRMAERRAVNG